MSAYRFCRTDDIPLLVDAYRRCWLPHFPDASALAVEDFKREIRDLQVWCSSCMVALAGDELIGFLAGAKRARETLIHRIAIQPDHVRQGHARHLLTSLSSKLAILGPPRLVVEIPHGMDAVRALFESCGYEREATLTDYELAPEGRSPGSSGPPPDDTFLVPLTMEDVQANDLLTGGPEVCWERGRETIAARGEAISGLAMATVDSIAAFVLHRKTADGVTELVALRAFEEDDPESFLSCLVDATARRNRGTIRFPRVDPKELSAELLTASGFRPGTSYDRYAAVARSA